MKSDIPLLISVAQGAKLLNLGKSSMWRLVWSGQIPSIRIGNRRMLRVTDVQEIGRNGVPCGPIRRLQKIS